jgi:hypothetical protein
VFDSAASHSVTIPNSASLKPTIGYTLETYCYIQNTGGTWASLIQYPFNNTSHTSPFFEWGLYLNMPSRLFHVRVDGTSAVSSPNAVWDFDSWTHLTATYSGQTVTFYVNGVSVGTESVGVTSITYNNPNNNVYIGRNASGSELYKGNVGVIRVYDRALSGVEVAQNFAAGRGRFGI